MTEHGIDWEALRAVFPPDEVHWRVGSTNADKTRGLALAYIDARAVMDRLDAVVGPEHWMDTYREAGDTTMCRLAIRIGEEWVQKEDGAGDTQVEPEKGSLSDAFKRAAVKWGIGRYLYSLPAQWVEIEKGRIKTPPKLPAWALPAKAPDQPVEPAPKPAAPQSAFPVHLSPAALTRFRKTIGEMATAAGSELWAAALEATGYTDEELGMIVGREAATEAHKVLQQAIVDIGIDGVSEGDHHDAE